MIVNIPVSRHRSLFLGGNVYRLNCYNSSKPATPAWHFIAHAFNNPSVSSHGFEARLGASIFYLEFGLRGGTSDVIALEEESHKHS